MPKNIARTGTAKSAARHRRRPHPVPHLEPVEGAKGQHVEQPEDEVGVQPEGADVDRIRGQFRAPSTKYSSMEGTISKAFVRPRSSAPRGRPTMNKPRFTSGPATAMWRSDGG